MDKEDLALGFWLLGFGLWALCFGLWALGFVLWALALGFGLWGFKILERKRKAKIQAGEK